LSKTGGTTFNSNDPIATTEEFAQAQKAAIERAKKDAEAKQKQQLGSCGDGKTTAAPSSKNSEPKTNHEKGAVGEETAHKEMVENGYKPIGNKDGQYQPGQSGIDGVYEVPAEKQPPKYVIVEAKYNKAKLGKTKDGKQMNDEWVKSDDPPRLKKAGLSKKEQKEIKRGLDRDDGSVEKVVIRTKPDRTTSVKNLDSNVKVIGDYQL
jgi:type VI secretion system secreted protein VgrG